MKLEHQDPKNICYAQMLFFRAALPTEGRSRSNEIILYKNMCSTLVVTHENENRTDERCLDNFILNHHYNPC